MYQYITSKFYLTTIISRKIGIIFDNIKIVLTCLHYQWNVPYSISLNGSSKVQSTIFQCERIKIVIKEKILNKFLNHYYKLTYLSDVYLLCILYVLHLWMQQ